MDRAVEKLEQRHSLLVCILRLMRDCAGGAKSQASWATRSYWLLDGNSLSLVGMRGIVVERQVLWKDGSQELLVGQDFGLARVMALLWKPGGCYIPLVIFSSGGGGF